MTALATTFSLACPPKDGKMQQGSQGRQAEGGRIPCQVWIPLPSTSSPVSHKTSARGGVSNLRMTFQSTASTRGLSHFEGRTASPLVRGVREGRMRLFGLSHCLFNVNNRKPSYLFCNTE